MKKAASNKSSRKSSDELANNYHCDYSKAKPNRFAKRIGSGQIMVPLDSDVAKVFTTPESVNKALRALIEAMPSTTRSA
jgi:hypothetical protein